MTPTKPKVQVHTIKVPGPKGKTVKFKMVTSVIKAKPGKLLWKPKPPTGPDPIKPEQYLGSWGTPYNKDGARGCGYLCLPVLQDLWGRKLDEVVMAYVHSLRPSVVRITDAGIKLDCRLWRVTIWVEKVKRSRFVRRIEQEVEVLLPQGVAHGDALRLARRFGINSPEVKWHLDADGYAHTPLGYYKMLKGGGSVKWAFKSGEKNPKLWRKVK